MTSAISLTVNNAITAALVKYSTTQQVNAQLESKATVFDLQRQALDLKYLKDVVDRKRDIIDSYSRSDVDLRFETATAPLARTADLVAAMAAKADVRRVDEIGAATSALSSEIVRRALASDVYTKAEINDMIRVKANASDVESALATKAQLGEFMASYTLGEARYNELQTQVQSLQQTIDRLLSERFSSQ